MKKVTFLVSLMLLVGITMVNAQRGQRFNDENIRVYKNQCAIPNLTEEQEAKIETLKTAHWNSIKEHHADLSILRAELRKMQISDNPDRSAIEAKIEAMGEIRTDMHKERNQHRLDVRELLTDEQKSWFDRRGHRFGREGYGRRHGRRGQGFRGGNGAGNGVGCGMGYGRGYQRW